MLLKSIEQQPLRSLQYMERYVNDGSPSGFTEKYRPASITDPFGLTPYYNPLYLQAEPSSIEVFGYVPDTLPTEELLGANWFVIHPDMGSHTDLNQYNVHLLNNLRVVPTSSGRTVQILSSESNDYIKLHYDGYIGRIDRKLPRDRAISGPEVSFSILEVVERRLLPEHFCIFHETGAKILSLNGDNASVTWGLVWRESRPRGPNADRIIFLLPLFALWSIDRLRSYDPPLLEPICKSMGAHAASQLMEDLLFPIVDSYFGLLLQLGFQVELNAQNLLVGFDENWRPIAVVLRDLMGTEKDIGLRKFLGLNTDFESAPYKILNDSDLSYCQIRHSFVFDFKVSMYVLDPIIECASLLQCLNAGEASEALRERTRMWITKLPAEFFAEDRKWYRHDKVLLEHPRKYIAEQNPRYR